MKITLFALLLLVSSPIFAAKIPVVASFSILANMLDAVGGERVQVTSLVGANQDAHVFQPTPNDLRHINSAKVFVINGLGFEGWMNRLNKSADFKGRLIIASKGITPLLADNHAHNHQSIDPHAWNDPVLAQIYIKNITQGLSKADPQGKTYYQQRAAAYLTKLKNIDSWARASFSKLKIAQRKVLTTHDAFAYLGRRYQIQFLSIQGVSTDSEASAKTVAALIRQVKKSKIKAIFLENMTDKRMMEQLANEAGVSIQGKLYADALSPNNQSASTYMKLLQHNTTALLNAMQKNQ